MRARGKAAEGGEDGVTPAGSTLIFSRRPLREALLGLSHLGFGTVELAAVEGWAHIAPSRLVADFGGELEGVRQGLVDAGLRPVAINAGLGAADPVERHARARALFDLASALGVGVVTLPAGPAEDGAAAAAATLRPLLEEARARGVTLAVETHIGAVTERPAAAVSLCLAVPGLHLTLDPSHYWAGPAQQRGWRDTVPFVAHVHLRDAGAGGWDEIQVWPGRGSIDFALVAAALRQAGYAGTWAVEYIDTLPVRGGPGAAAAAATLLAQARGLQV